MEYTKIKTLVKQCHELAAQFSEKTNSFPMDVEENKKYAQWSLNYNLIKLQFVFTKKEKLMCPTATLYCRIFLGKNDDMYFHIPELIEYLDKDDFKCYIFPYIESEERLRICFEVIEKFLIKHFDALNVLALDDQQFTLIKQRKLDELFRVCEFKEENKKQKELIEYWMGGYERFVILPRFAGEGAYREFLRGKYAKALKLYDKFIRKNTATDYEMRLVNFIESLKKPYEAMPEACASVLEIEKYNGSKAEGISILKGFLILELLFGCVISAMFFAITELLSVGSIFYCGINWYWGFMISALPAMFGAISFRRKLAKFTQRKNYDKAMDYDELVNTRGVDKFSKITFAAVMIFTIVMSLSLLSYDSVFYKDYLKYSVDDGMISIREATCYYENLEKIIYSEGVYNEFGDYIDRPAYLLCFSDGKVWNSDNFVTLKTMEENILPIVKNYVEEISIIESRNEYIE